MALVDANFKFIRFDVGPDGAGSDAHIYNECGLKEVLKTGLAGFSNWLTITTLQQVNA